MTKKGIAGGEPDESFCFDEKKDVSDLVIEVALTSGGLSKRKFYNTFQVPELWFWRNDKLEIFLFNQELEDYEAAKESKMLPSINLIELTRCALIDSTSDAVLAFRETFPSEQSA